MVYHLRIDIDKLKEEIKRRGWKKVLIQLPDGLKPRAKEIADELEKAGIEVYIWIGSNYGGCDIPEVDFVDGIINFGHKRGPR